MKYAYNLTLQLITFWLPLALIAFLYGWQLALLITLIHLGAFLQMRNAKLI